MGQAHPELGWLAERVDEVRLVPKAELQAVPGGVAEARRKFLRGVTAGALSVLDGEALLKDETFYF